MTVFCKDCRFAVAEGLIFKRWKFSKCAKTVQPTPDDYFLVGGISRKKIEPEFYCATARKFDDMCGPDAAWFEPRL